MNLVPIGSGSLGRGAMGISRNQSRFVLGSKGNKFVVVTTPNPSTERYCGESRGEAAEVKRVEDLLPPPVGHQVAGVAAAPAIEDTTATGRPEKLNDR